MMEFIPWVIFTKIVSQVVIIKKIAIIEKDCDYWKTLWLLLWFYYDYWWLFVIICYYWWLFVIIEKDCSKINLVVI